MVPVIASKKPQLNPRRPPLRDQDLAIALSGILASLQELAGRYGLRVIEGAAEVIGQKYKGVPYGGIGDISTLSFYPNKHITTGEGGWWGMVLTNDEELTDRARGLRNLCFGKQHRFMDEALGWNFRMSNLQRLLVWPSWSVWNRP
jgi:perosamine synthetase